jgi:hypothetical protein
MPYKLTANLGINILDSVGTICCIEVSAATAIFIGIVPFGSARRADRGRGVQVRVSEDARKCSVILGWSASTAENPEDITPAGTGFLVYAGDSQDDGVYLVTAGHVAKKLKDEPFVIRFNDKSGPGKLEHLDLADWKYPLDETIDIAVWRYLPPDWTDCVALPASEFMDDERLSHFEVGPGDAVYLVGLFHLHTGKKRNLITVHSGNISLLPTDEKLPVNDGDPIDNVYLIEMQTLLGASGSPVYIRPTYEFRGIDCKYKMESIFHAEGRDYLLGVWIAAWPGKPDAVSSPKCNSAA